MQSGKMVCVDKGEWDKGGTLDIIRSIEHEKFGECKIN